MAMAWRLLRTSGPFFDPECSCRCLNSDITSATLSWFLRRVRFAARLTTFLRGIISLSNRAGQSPPARIIGYRLSKLSRSKTLGR